MRSHPVAATWRRLPRALVVTDPDRASGRVLMLDGAPHSYVDLDDPTYLQFDYAKAVVSAIDTAYAEGLPLRVYHIGGGGLTLPRYLEHVRPGRPAWCPRSILALSRSTPSSSS